MKKKIPNEEEILFRNYFFDVQAITKKGRDIQPLRKSIQKIKRKTVKNNNFAVTQVGETIEGHISSVHNFIIENLKNGLYPPSAQIDLHRLTVNQAYDRLISFIDQACIKEYATVLIITGKGKNSPFGSPIIKEMVKEWLIQKPFKDVVKAFSTALEKDGGTGAFYVLLNKKAKFPKNTLVGNTILF